MTHKIAIIVTDTHYNSYDDCTRVISSITDWAIVSDDEYKLLHKASSRRGYSIIEQPENQSEFIAQTVAEEIARIKAEEIALAEAKEHRAALAEAKRYKKELKDKESKIALLKKLQEELGNELT
jgi:t-SNARE complex subunit (syntaxin)